ncbi:9195_t:CDS:1, partial [Acaulospora colombiana]
MTTFSKLNDLQRKSLVDLFAHIKHFNQKFTTAASLDKDFSTNFLDNMRSTSNSLFTHFIYQSNVIVDKKIFKTLRQENEEWDEEIRRFKKFVELLNRGNKQFMNRYFYQHIYEPSDSELSSEHSGLRKDTGERNSEGNVREKESETRVKEPFYDEKAKKKSTHSIQRKLDKKLHSTNKEKDEILKEKSKLVKEKEETLKRKDVSVKEKEKTKKFFGNSKEKGVVYSSDKFGFHNKNKHHLATFLKKEDTETDDSIERRLDICKKKSRVPQLLIDESEVEEIEDLVKFGYISKAEYMMKRFEEVNLKIKKIKHEEDMKTTGVKKSKKRNHLVTANN